MLHEISAFIRHAAFCFRRTRMTSWPTLLLALACVLAVKLRIVRSGRAMFRIGFKEFRLHVNGFSAELCAYWENYLDRQYGAGIARRGHVCIVDAGANTGIFSLQQVREHPDDITLVAVEPDPEVFGRLQKHLAASMGGRNRIQLLNLALAANNGSARLIRDRSTNSHIADPSEGDAAGVDVRTDTLDNIVRSYGLRQIDLLKIDVEGFEMQVLQGASAEALPITHEIALEYHEGNRTPVVQLLESQDSAFHGATNRSAHWVSAGPDGPFDGAGHLRR